MTMLNNTLFRHPRAEGVQVLQKRGDAGAHEISTRRVVLAPGGAASITIAGEEAVVIVQQGRAAFSVAGRSWEVSRRDVFSERATALFLPPGATLEIRSRAEATTGGAAVPFEAVIFSTPSTGAGEPALITPDQVQVNARGRANYSREVHNIFVDDPHVRRLMVGETFNPPGNWSSFPPHKHDGRDGEPALEEVYYYRVDPPQGFGQQMLYTNDGECVTHSVRDGDTVLLPYGYHPVSSPPGYRLYYLWGMAGEQRKLALHEDPAHRWIHDAP
jgi:5-deoxy-glucuronate isomerase